MHHHQGVSREQPARRGPDATADYFEQAYQGHPPWDIGRPQAALVALAEAGAIPGAVLDAGCGTGEHALYMAGRGQRVVGIDLAPTALAQARAKAAYRKLEVPFVRADVLDMRWLGRQFDSVIDSGLFHVLDGEQRALYIANLEAVLRPGGSLHLLCFSQGQSEGLGPRAVRPEELRDSFAPYWELQALGAARFETLFHDHGARAWLASLRFTGHAWPLLAPRGRRALPEARPERPRQITAA